MNDGSTHDKVKIEEVKGKEKVEVEVEVEVL